MVLLAAQVAGAAVVEVEEPEVAEVEWEVVVAVAVAVVVVARAAEAVVPEEVQEAEVLRLPSLSALRSVVSP